MKKCTNCNQEFNDNVTCCPNCGSKLIAQNQTSKETINDDADEKPNFQQSSDNVPQGTPPSLNQNSTSSPNNAEDNHSSNPKKKQTAGILAILLGSVGVHYFYCKKVLPGIVFLLVTLLFYYIHNFVDRSTIFLLLQLAPTIISIIQGIVILSSSQEDFEKKYVLTDKKFPLF